MPILAMRSAGFLAAMLQEGTQKIDNRDQLCQELVLEDRLTGGHTWYVRISNFRGRRSQLRLWDAENHTIAKCKDPAVEGVALRRLPIPNIL